MRANKSTDYVAATYAQRLLCDIMSTSDAEDFFSTNFFIVSGCPGTLCRLATGQLPFGGKLL
jgi:hypothetical protein